MSNNKLLREVAAGAAAGLLATVPMTVTMLVIQRLLPRRQQSTLEPRRITEGMLRRVDLKEDLSKKERDRVSVAAHFGYGATVGALYPLVEGVLPLPRGLRGPAYGLCVWAASYAGWLPAVDILPPPQRRPAGRNLLLIAAHLVWGATTEAVSEALSRRAGARSVSQLDVDALPGVVAEAGYKK